MKVLQKNARHLVVGGWKPVAILMAVALLVSPVGFYLLTGWEESWMMWANLLVAVVAIGIGLRMTLWERIAFDTETGEVVFDQLVPTGHSTRTVSLKPVSRVEIETAERISRAGGRPTRRLILVTGHESTPFTPLFSSSGRLDAERDLLNRWLEDAFGDQWRDAAARLREASSPDTEANMPVGVTRLRHPRTGLTIDVPEDWSVSVSFDKSGPLQLFGLTLMQRLDRPGPRRAPNEGGDWNNLVVVGAEDAGLQLAIHDGPLDRTLESTLDDPWSKAWGGEPLQTTPKVEIGGMSGFSISRPIPEGGSTSTFGKVSAAVATRQVWLGADGLHLEAVGMARLDHPDIQHAIDAMFESIRLPVGT